MAFVVVVALMAAIPSAAATLSIANFSVTSGLAIYTEDMDAAVQSEFGSTYRQADWNDIVLYYQEGNDMSELTSLLSVNSWVSRSGADLYSSNRHYYAAVHNHNTPGNFQVHANIDNNLIDLGSWDGSRPILAFTSAPVPEPSTALLLSMGLVAMSATRRRSRER
jgi:hypothetical protein